MGKRTSYERKERDFYPTPLAAVVPLYRFVSHELFCEPCAGEGHLIANLRYVAKCMSAYDIEPPKKSRLKNRSFVAQLDARDLTEDNLNGAKLIITNPPWKWEILSKLIDVFVSLRPTWLLLNGDLLHNNRFAPYMEKCSVVVPVGRVSWMQNGVTGYENTAWYLFDKDHKSEYSRLMRKLV
jgi:hypothetical protein